MNGEDWKSAIRTKAEFEKEINERRKKYKVSGIFFDQFFPQTIHTFQKYSNFCTDANTITLDDIQPLFLRPCFDRDDLLQKRQISSIPKYYFFIDEKDQKNHFIMGGILIHEEYLGFLNKAILNLKKIIVDQFNLPINDINNYYIKGESNQQIYDETINSFKKHEFNKQMSFEKWRIFGEILEKFHNQYSFHFSIVDKKSCSKEELLEKTIENLTMSLKGFHFDHLEIITDDLDDGSRNKIDQSLKKYSCNISHQTYSLNIVPKNDRSSNETTALLQYVDLCVYAFSRFVSPSFNEATQAYSLLADFEIYKYKQPSGKEIDPKVIQQFDIIKNVFYNLCFSILYDLYPAYSEKANSSVIFSDDKDHVNAGKDICHAIRKFCSRESSIFDPDRLFIDFNDL